MNPHHQVKNIPNLAKVTSSSPEQARNYSAPLKPCIFSSKCQCPLFCIRHTLPVISDTVKPNNDGCGILSQQTCQQKTRVRHKLLCSFNPELLMVQKSWRGFESGLQGEAEEGLDEYAFHYCCNVMTSLMRSVESWVSHFVVSPIHSPAQQIHCGLVLRHSHSDGWMHLLMFQTTEHHSVPFLWSTYKHTGVL